MYEVFGDIIGRTILNYIGGTIRWIYGTIWRSIFYKPKYKYSEYIHGPKNSKDYFDKYGHEFNNRVIATIFIVIIVLLFMK